MTTSSTAQPKKRFGIVTKFVLNQLSQLKGAKLTVMYKGHHLVFGDDDSLQATIVVHDDRFFTAVALGGSIGAAECYANNVWDSPNLTDVIRVMAKNIAVTNSLDSKLTLLTKPLSKLYHWRNRNTQEQARRNISQHYDLGNDFFKLFLDPTMAYSSGYFTDFEQSMEQASINKFERICQRLELKETDRVIEIGSGWGGLAVYAAEHYGCHVTTTTISKEQYDYCASLIKAKGLESKITLLFDDYRDLEGQFDKLMSCEMIEAVGWQYLATYFDKIGQLLRPQGKAVIQAITINDNRYAEACKSVDFIQRYIFPGGFLPCASVISHEASMANLRCVGYEDFANSYRETIKRWRLATIDNIDVIQRLGLNEQFIRMWLFYFAYCEGGFAEQQIGVGHFEFVAQ